MTEATLDFHDTLDVQKYVDEHGLDRLRHLLMNGYIHPHDRRVAEVWYWEKAERDGERSAGAAETSARASVVSAAAAKDAARWSRWSVVVAAAALIFSAWAFIKDAPRPDARPAAVRHCRGSNSAPR